MHLKRINYSTFSPFDFEIPDVCPHCGQTMEPFVIDMVMRDEEHKFIILCRCTINDCQKYFVLDYVVSRDHYNFNQAELVEYSYTPLISLDLSDKIQVLSPKFVEIYKQALLVKQYRLNDIVGLAYRKAVEFLIKDYAIYIDPQNEETYKAKFLNEVIKLIFKDNERLLKISKATVYVGNDFTHYEARNPNKDIKDMELFIELLISSINSELVYLEAQKFVDSK